MKKFYRPDIDALRGIAVLSVLFYHAKFSIFNQNLFIGGFLGVDIFFVLTGYLITTMLLGEHKNNNSIDVFGFYLRRIRRLIPALLVVISISTLFSFFLLDPQKIKEFSQSVYFSLVFLPNFYFHYFGNFYGQDVNLFKPLLHLWSLGIEEQFYVFYPLFIIITFKYFKRFFIFFLFIGFTLSILFAEYASTYHKMFSFYMLPSRAWEIILGSILGFYLLKKKNILQISDKSKSLLYLTSIIILIYFIFNFDIHQFKHPTSITIIPLLAVSTIIILGANATKNIFYNILSNKVLVFFGKISYSLYLYHFIIFSFFRNSFLEENIIVKFFLVLISILFSYLSYSYIEQVFRNKKLPIKNLIFFIGFFTLGILSFNSYFSLNKNLLKKDYIIDGIRITEWHDTVKARKDLSKFNTESFLKNGNTNVLISGNCHSNEIYLSLIYNQNKFKKYNFSHIQYDFENLENIILSNNQKYKDSNIIILNSRWDKESADKKFEKLEILIKKFKKDEKKIILISSFPEFKYKKYKYKLRNVYLTNYKKKLIDKKSSDLSEDEIKSLRRKYYLDYKENKWLININKKLKEISIESDIEYLEFSDLICDHKTQSCNFRLEKSKDEIFRDYGRFSHKGLKYIGELLYERKLLSM
tara:strand:- start:2228 stop:4150 length:1923 start_codon:yes stop_codon:yes gene_type:complete